jgi:hypothetical protein
MLTDIIVILLLSRKERCIENEEPKMSDQVFVIGLLHVLLSTISTIQARGG